MDTYTGKYKNNKSRAISNNLPGQAIQGFSSGSGPGNPETDERSDPGQTAYVNPHISQLKAYQHMANPSGRGIIQRNAVSLDNTGADNASGTTSPVIQRVIAENDLEGGDVPGDQMERVLSVLNSYNEEGIRENLDLIRTVFSTVEDWGNYTDQDIRNVIGECMDLFTLKDGASNNPWLHILMDDFGLASPRILIDDANEVDGYIALAQTCSVMSVVWLRDSRAEGQYSIRSAINPEAVSRTIFENQTPDDQFTWAEQETGFTRVNSAPDVQQLRALGNGGRFILYSPVHVSAGIVNGDNFLYYDPETGSASVVDENEMGIYVVASARYLHS